MSINLRAVCVTAAKQAVKEYDISVIIALGKEEPDVQDIEKIKEICRKYAPDWQELFALNRKDIIDESMISCLDKYFFTILVVLSHAIQDFTGYLKTEQAA